MGGPTRSGSPFDAHGRTVFAAFDAGQESGWLRILLPAANRQPSYWTKLREFVETTHNTRYLIEVLALQALLQERQGQRQSALELLEQAVVLAEPGGFIRLFVDLGPPLDQLLDRLRWQEGAKGSVAVDYVTQILNAFEAKAGGQTADATSSSPLVDPLTPRELQVLALLGRHLTNKEIAAELVISTGTVKTHTLNIYRKLGVRKRREAVARAQELNIL